MDPQKEADFLEGTKNRLRYYGVTIPPGDTSRDDDIRFSISACSVRVCEFCNIDEIPEMIYPVFSDMCACDYLAGKLGAGQMPLEDIVSIAQSIKVGDTQVSYGQIGSAETMLLNYMNNKAHNMSQFMAWRKIKW